MPQTDPDRGQMSCAVLLADSHPLFRAGMRYLMQELSPGAELLEAATPPEALSLVGARDFDLVLTGLFSSEADWERYLADLLAGASEARVVVVSVLQDPLVVRKVLKAGAHGYVLKDTVPEVTLQAIRLVLAGGIYIPPAALGEAPDGTSIGQMTVAGEIELSDRQRAVLTLLPEGTGNKQIARILDISPSAVKAHVASLLRTFRAKNRKEIVRMASERGLLPTSVELQQPHANRRA